MSDFLVIGGGIAGLSAAARLSVHGKVSVIEAEEALGYHSSGRSATFSHYGIGNRAVRAMTHWSRTHFESVAVRTAPALFFATEEMLPGLELLAAEMAEFAPRLERVGEAEMQKLFPPLRLGHGAALAGCLDPDGLKLDSDALLQAFARTVRTAGGEILNARRVDRIEHKGDRWTVSAGQESWSAPVLVNAAGAWADEVAAMAQIAPLGLTPLRRTIVVVDAPGGADVRNRPFTKSAVDDFYILPESGRLAASPVDEVESDPCDAQPEDYDVALAAWKIEKYTTLPVARIAHRWAGLRSFTSDRVPVAGFAPDAAGFFWLAGQGGYGLQTAPAMAAISESLIVGGPWPEGLAALGAGPAEIDIERLVG